MHLARRIVADVPSSQSIMPPIPPELCDHVVDFLHHDLSSLRECSLTCRAFIPTTRVHLFHTISLHTPKLCTAFGRLLDMSPYLGYYVRELSIARLGARTGMEKHSDVADFEAGELLSLILHHLSGVQTLEFYLTDLPQTFRPQCHAPLTELSLVACSFSAFDDFVDLFYSFPRLEHLHLDTIRWNTRPLDLRPHPVSPKLRRLTVGRDADLCLLVEWLLTGELYHEIDSISVRCTSELEAIAAGVLLEALGPSLQDLTLDWYLPTASSTSSISRLFACPLTLCRSTRSSPRTLSRAMRPSSQLDATLCDTLQLFHTVDHLPPIRVRFG